MYIHTLSGDISEQMTIDFSSPKKVCKITYLQATPKEERMKIKCNFCECEYATVRNLKKHLKLKHPDDQMKKTNSHAACIN